MQSHKAAKNNRILSTATIGVIVSILAAVSEALYAPLTKLISADAGTMASVAFIFFGAGCGSLLIRFFGRKSKAIYDPKRRLQKKDTGKLISLTLLSLLGIALLLIGVKQESATTASVLLNVVTITTILFAALFLKEKISKRLGIGVGLIILGSLALAITNLSTFSISTGSLLVIAGCVVTGGVGIISKLLADRNPVDCNIIRGFGAGGIALIIALFLGETLPNLPNALGFMAAGFIGSGLSPILMMYGQRYLGAAKTGAIFGIHPLLGVLLAIPLLGEIPGAAFLAALILFIPGMYFVITKNSRAEAVKAEDAGKPDEGDTQFLTSINDDKKNGLKNYVTSFGLLLIALFFLLMMLDLFNPGAAGTDTDTLPAIPAVLSILVLLCSIVLLMLGKRVMAAVTFILTVPQMLGAAVLGGLTAVNVISGIFAIIFALILMTSKDPQRYAFAVINLLLGVASVSHIFDNTVCGWIMATATVFLIWLSVTCGTDKLRFSISKYLVRDGDMTFGKCGAVIGFLMLAVISVITFVYEFSDRSFFAYSDSVLLLGLIDAGLLIFVGLLLLLIGKRKMNSILFIGSGAALSLDMLSSGVFVYLPVVLLLVVGILNVVRSDQRILPAILVIGNAFATMLYGQLIIAPEVETAMLLLTAMCAAVAVYLSFAVFSEKPKLPLF